jgi:hypothetical protein
VKQTRASIGIERITQEWKSKPQWWREVLYVVVFYALYSAVRNIHGSILSVQQAKQHAQDVVSAERSLGLFHEQQIQSWFLPHTWLIKLFDDYYGSAHFIITVGVLLWLYHMKTERYRKWRNVIFGTTFFALMGYLIYPLAPPRLLPAHYGFVDTLSKVGGLWNFNSHAVEQVSNQYAAMPSLHVAWALWCALAILPVLRHTWTRVAIILYPLLTITAVIATANHYWFDVFGGALAFGLGYALADLIDRRRRVMLDRRIRELETAQPENAGTATAANAALPAQ